MRLGATTASGEDDTNSNTGQQRQPITIKRTRRPPITTKRSSLPAVTTKRSPLPTAPHPPAVLLAEQGL